MTDKDTERVVLDIDASLARKFKAQAKSGGSTATAVGRTLFSAWLDGRLRIDPDGSLVLGADRTSLTLHSVGLSEDDVPMLLAIKEYLDSPSSDPVVAAMKDNLKHLHREPFRKKQK